MPGGYGAVLVEQPVEGMQHQVVGAVVHEGSEVEFAASPGTHLVVLSHPAEHRILKSLGYTWDDLRREGRYVACTNVVCDECGWLFSHKRLAVPGGCMGCVVPLLVAVMAGSSVGYWSSSVLGGWFAACGIGYLSTLVLDWRLAKPSGLTFRKKLPTSNNKPLARSAVASEALQSPQATLFAAIAAR